MFRFVGTALFCVLQLSLNVIATSASADDVLKPKPSASNTSGQRLRGEVAVIEWKNGPAVAIEQAQTSIIAGQNFVGGKVIGLDANADSGRVAGSRIWIAASEIIRIVEFDTKAQYAGKTTSSDLDTLVAKIEALGGTVTRDENQPGSPVVAIDLIRSERLKDDDLLILGSFPELRSLHLFGTAVTDDGLKHLSALKKLTYLGAGGTKITDAGLKHLTGLKDLIKLGLIGTKITDAGLKELVGLQNLEAIRLGDTAITDEGLKTLAQLKNLKSVGLIGTAVTEAGVKQFSAALPNMRHNWGVIDTAAQGDGGGGQRSDPDFDAKVAHPSYEAMHPNVLLDEAHNNFHTAGGRYKPFVDLVTNDGYRVAPNREKFTEPVLAKCDLLVIANALGEGWNGQGTPSKSAFTEEECQAVEKWVDSGGSLLLVTDFGHFGAPSAELGNRFGVEMSKGVTIDSANESNDGLLFSREKHLLGDHPIINGRNDSERVNRVLTFAGQSLKGPTDSTALLKFAETAVDRGPSGAASAADRTQGLAMRHGKGRVVVMGEAAELSAQVVGTERFGMNTPGCDNRQLALNIMHWLSGLTD